MELPREWSQMDAQELRDLSAALVAELTQREAELTERNAQLSELGEKLSAREAQIVSRDEELKRKQLKIDQLTYEMALIKRWRYARRSEQLDAVQRSLLDESIDADLEAISLAVSGILCETVRLMC